MSKDDSGAVSLFIVAIFSFAAAIATHDDKVAAGLDAICGSILIVGAVLAPRLADLKNGSAKAEDRCDVWRLIDDLPEEPCMVEIFSRDLMLRDGNDHPVSALIEPYRDERRGLAFFDGKNFFHTGTGHEVFEFFGEEGWPDSNYPTHWRRLPAPPA